VGFAAISSTAPWTLLACRCEVVLLYETCAAVGEQLQLPSGAVGISEQLPKKAKSAAGAA
jgi:hypothetical protein